MSMNNFNNETIIMKIHKKVTKELEILVEKILVKYGDLHTEKICGNKLTLFGGRYRY